MGEAVKLRNGLSGGFSLNDFLQQGDSQATTRSLIRAMLPVQEMREFQRRYLFDTASVSLFLGERISLLEWIVPANEYWKPLALMYQNADNVAHTVLVNFSMARSPAAVVYRVVRTTAPGNQTKVIYGSDQQWPTTGGNTSFFHSILPVTMEPDDIFSFTDLTPNNGASQQRWIFVYEQVPAPATARTPGVVGAVTVV